LLGALIGGAKEGEELGFAFEYRSRRPATDPVNAMLSFAYAMLVRELTATLSAVDFDHRGFYHQPRYGRPALALDLMEPFRPIPRRFLRRYRDQQRRGKAAGFCLVGAGLRASAGGPQENDRGVRKAARDRDHPSGLSPPPKFPTHRI
jgi:hypothetical protein